jgi:hypothetical protein
MHERKIVIGYVKQEVGIINVAQGNFRYFPARKRSWLKEMCTQNFSSNHAVINILEV